MDLEKHSNLSGEDIHTPFAFVFNDEAERLAATGFLESDKNKFAVQEVDLSFQILTNVSPVTQKQIG